MSKSLNTDSILALNLSSKTLFLLFISALVFADEYKMNNITGEMDLYISDHSKLKSVGSKTHSRLEEDITKLNDLVSVYDEGTYQGIVSSFNFTGNGVTVTIAGGTATVSISGIAGGGGSIGGYENGVFKVTVTTLNIQSPLTADVADTSITVTLPTTADVTIGSISGDGNGLTNLSTGALANASLVATSTQSLRDTIDTSTANKATVSFVNTSTSDKATISFVNTSTSDKATISFVNTST